MDIMFNDEEAIDLILLFYTPFNGVLETDIEEYSGMRKLIENDAVDLNDGWYSLNNKGYSIMEAYIDKYSREIISIFKKHGFYMSEDMLYGWFSEEYHCLNDSDTKDIVNYLLINLHNRGYEACKSYSSKKGSRFYIRQIEG